MAIARNKQTDAKISHDLTHDSTLKILSSLDIINASSNDKLLPAADLPAINTDNPIEPEKVKANRLNKLYGTFGETIVVFHDASSTLGAAIRTLQDKIVQRLGIVSQDLRKGIFVDKDGLAAKPTSFAPILNPHTTIIAMRVIDASDLQSWNECLIESFLYAKFSQYQAAPDERIQIESAKQAIIMQRNLDHLFQELNPDLLKKVLSITDPATDIRKLIEMEAPFTPLDRKKEIEIVRKIEKNPVLMLELDSISLSPNGSLGIRWKINHDILLLRTELSELGGIPKHGADIITTTIGYFPYCTEASKAEIHQAVQDSLPDFLQTIETNPHRTSQADICFEIDINKAQLVKFSRNDLHPDYIIKTDLFANEQLCDEYHLSAFPSQLLQQKNQAQKAVSVKPIHMDTMFNPRVMCSMNEIGQRITMNPVNASDKTELTCVDSNSKHSY
jgi:hypothetical protein